MISPVEIAERVVESILAQKLLPGERLGEQQLADIFGGSRTLVREALMRLHARGFVEVRARKGWYVVEPSLEHARDAFAARRAVESGLLHQAGRPLQSAIRKLREHVKAEQDAIRGTDAATRTFLLADFHVCLADCLGHKVLSEMLRDLTARTMLVSSLYQSTTDATQSCTEHEAIVDHVEKGDIAGAAKLMMAHINHVESSLSGAADVVPDLDARMRASLTPLTARNASA